MANPKTKYRYYGLEALEMTKDERPCYCRFAVANAETKELLVEFYTNKDLEGRFTFDERTCTYRQTCQYSLAGLKAQAVRVRLRKEAEEAE